MKSSRIFFFGIIVAVVLIMVYSFMDTGVKDSYEQKIMQFRTQKDNDFKTLSESPIPDKEHFKKLSYFPPDPSYRIMATIEPIEDTTRLEIRMTGGKEEAFIRYGYARFTLEGKAFKLLLLQSVGEESDELFLPFMDQTNGFDTYGGGRYLYPEQPEDEKQLVLDFNLAFNPYCAYNEDYSCPIPPKENFLDIAIKAGEKGYEKPEKAEQGKKEEKKKG